MSFHICEKRTTKNSKQKQIYHTIFIYDQRLNQEQRNET